MTPELRYLVYTSILTGCLWIPVVIGYVSSRGALRPADYKVAPTSKLPDWVNRANRAHVNAVESFASFAAVVLVAHATHVSTSITATAAMVFFVSRVAHAVVHISGFQWARARTVIFTVAWGAFMTIAIELLRHA